MENILQGPARIALSVLREKDARLLPINLLARPKAILIQDMVDCCCIIFRGFGEQNDVIRIHNMSNYGSTSTSFDST